MAEVALKDVTYTINDHDILKGIDLNILEGKVTTIIGPNGCGKSTLLKTLAKLITTTDGCVYIDDLNIKQLKSKDMAKKVGILSQKNRLQYDVPVQQLMNFSRYPHLKKFQPLKEKDFEIIEWALCETGAIDFKDRMMGELSGGQQQRVWISLLLAQGTDILLLDEPTTYLDIHHQLETLNIIERLNRETEQTIIMVLHDMNHAIKYSDEIIVMDNGEIINQGKPREVLTNDILNDVFNINGRIEMDSITKRPYLADYELFCETIKGARHE